MALVYVGGKSALITGSVSDNTTISLTDLTGGVASAPADGDIVIVGYAICGINTIPDPVVITSGYTELAEVEQFNANDSINLSVAYKIQGSTPDTQVVVGPTSNAGFFGSVAIHVWRGVDPTTPLDATRTTATANNNTAVNPPAITTVTNGAVAIVFGGLATRPGQVTTFSSLPDLSNTLVDGVDPGNSYAVIGVGSSLRSTAGAFDPSTWSISPSITAFGRTWGALTLALRPAPEPDPVTATVEATAPTLTFSNPVASASGAFSIDPVTGNISATAPTLLFGAPVASASATFSVDPVTVEVTATAPALILGQPTASAAAAFSIDAVSAEVAATAPSLIFAAPVAEAAATFATPGVTATIEATAPTLIFAQPVAAAEGSFATSGVTATIAATAPTLILGQPVASAEATFAAPGVTAEVTATAPTLIFAQPVAEATALYTSFAVIAPSIVFKVEREPTVFAVPREPTVFTVAREQTTSTVPKEVAA